MTIQLQPLYQLLDKKTRIFIYSTGYQTGIVSKLLDIPGSSSFFVGAGIPYDTKKTVQLLGHIPTQFVSEEVSIDLAQKAYMEALDLDAADTNTIGVGITAAISTNRVKKGDCRAFITLISDHGSFHRSTVFQKGVGSTQRHLDGEVIDIMVEHLILKGAGISDVEEQEFNQQVLNNLLNNPYFKADGTRGQINFSDTKEAIFFPGSFNPPHFGHFGIAQEALESSGDEKVIFSTTINPAHKPALTVPEILRRVYQMRGHHFLLTKDDPTFLDKARKFPNSIFVMGADTLDRMMSPSWGNPIEPMLQEFIKLNTKFMVCARKMDGKLLWLTHIVKKHSILQQPQYREIFRDLQCEFDISSTELRNKIK